MRKHKEVRREQIKKRKNFLPTLFITIICWASLGFIVYFFDPSTLGVLPLFFLILFFAFLFSFSIITGSSRRGLIISLGLTLFAILRYLGVGNILNFILISGISVVAEFYFSRS